MDSETFELKKVECNNFEEYKRYLDLYATSKRLKKKKKKERELIEQQQPQEEQILSGEGIVSVITEHVPSPDLREVYDFQQNIRRRSKTENCNSDSDSEADFDNAINLLVKEGQQTIFYESCCQFNLNTLVIITSLVSVTLALVLCFFKLYTSDEEYVVTGYLAILGMIVGQFLGVFGFLKNKND